MKFNVLKNEILEQLENLRKVFEIIPKEKLSPRRNGVNYEITLKTKKIKSSLLSSTRPKKQKIIKEYLNEITKKE